MFAWARQALPLSPYRVELSLGMHIFAYKVINHVEVYKTILHCLICQSIIICSKVIIHIDEFGTDREEK